MPVSIAKFGDQLGRRQDGVREGRPVDLEGGVHRLLAKCRGRILHERDVVAEFHPEASGRLDAGVGDHAHEDDFSDVVLLELEVEVGVGEAALSPVSVAKLIDVKSAILEHDR
jgi:hypothetical protein